MVQYASQAGTTAATAAEYSTLQKFFLERLDRFLLRKNEEAITLTPDGIGLLDRAIFSTYRDCVDQGVGEYAQKLIDRYQPQHHAGITSS